MLTLKMIISAFFFIVSGGAIFGRLFRGKIAFELLAGVVASISLFFVIKEMIRVEIVTIQTPPPVVVTPEPPLTSKPTPSLPMSPPVIPSTLPAPTTRPTAIDETPHFKPPKTLPLPHFANWDDVKKLQLGDYILEIREKKEVPIEGEFGNDAELIISKNAERVYIEQFIFFEHVFFEDGSGLIREIKEPANNSIIVDIMIPPGKGELKSSYATRIIISGDITKSESYHIIIGTKSTGASGQSINYKILALGKSIRTIAELSNLNTPLEVKDTDANGIAELIVDDGIFDYWDLNPSNAEAPNSPTVILEYQNGYYQPSIRLMSKPYIARGKLLVKASIINSKILNKIKFFPDPKMELTEIMLDLLYTGNGDLALELLNEAWPREFEGKNFFLESFKRQLLDSPYISSIMGMNPSFFENSPW